MCLALFCLLMITFVVQGFLGVPYKFMSFSSIFMKNDIRILMGFL